MVGLLQPNFSPRQLRNDCKYAFIFKPNEVSWAKQSSYRANETLARRALILDNCHDQSARNISIQYT
jgi:hypothetical protein